MITWERLFYLLDGNGIAVEDEDVLKETLKYLFNVTPDDEVGKIEIQK